MSLSKCLTATAVTLSLGAPAFAATATATQDLNLRSGPGTEYPVQTVIAARSGVNVEGCIAGADWCQVTYEGRQGWASSSYLEGLAVPAPVIAFNGGAQVVATGPVVEIATGEPRAVKLDDKRTAYYPAPKLRLIPAGVDASGNPVVAVPSIAAQPQIVTYVEQNPVAPIYLDGELVVGAGVPQDVTLYPVPEASYQYVNLNDHIVLVEPEGRRIVQVIR